MRMTSRLRTTLKLSAGAVGFAAAAYAANAVVAWVRYGQPQVASQEDTDALLDSFIPNYEVVERHHIRVAAPADITFVAACETDLMQSPVVRAIFKGRELVLASQPDRTERPRGLLAFTKSIGWGVLADVPGREIVMGAVTQPWEANVVFRPLPPDHFLAFHEPGYVKIAWTLRTDPTTPNESVFRTETRVTTTDSVARAKFRRYWSLFSPGIVLIRWLSLGRLRADAERRVAEARARLPELLPSKIGATRTALPQRPSGS
jgi:hypothetical protein